MTWLEYVFSSSTSFNQDISKWNVKLVTALTGAFDTTSALSSCNKAGIYQAWGTTLRTAYPTFNVATCAPTAAPSTAVPSTATPSTATPRCAVSPESRELGFACYATLFGERGTLSRACVNERVVGVCSMAATSTATPSTAVPSTAAPSTATPSTATPR